MKGLSSSRALAEGLEAGTWAVTPAPCPLPRPRGTVSKSAFPKGSVGKEFGDCYVE